MQCLTEVQVTEVRAAVIWVITAIATVSVISGIGYGIKFLSQLAFIMGTFLLLMVFFMDDTWFFLNLIMPLGEIIVGIFIIFPFCWVHELVRQY